MKQELKVVRSEKIKEVNKKVNKTFQKKSEWSFVPPAYLEFIKLVGGVLFLPVAMVFGILEGVRAGFIAGLQKSLDMYRGKL